MPKSQKRLVIDSATQYLYIGLFDGTTLLGDYYKKGHNDHSVKLMDELSKLFARLSTRVDELECIVVGIGPGSYTGVRIGVVVAKMLAWSKNIPLYTVSSLAMMASGKRGKVLPWIDARRGNAFLGLYEVQETTIRTIEDDRHTNLEQYRSTHSEDAQLISTGKPSLAPLWHSSLLQRADNIHSVAPSYLRETKAERTQGENS